MRGSVERELLREMAVIGVEVMVDSEEHDLGKEAPISEGERREKEDDTKEVDLMTKLGPFQLVLAVPLHMILLFLQLS